MLQTLRQQGIWNIGGLLTSVNERASRVSMHAVRLELLTKQALAAGLPTVQVPLPFPCSNDEYEQRMGGAVARAVAEGFTHVAFGDLFLEDVRRYREERLSGSGLQPIFPLWHRPTDELAKAMLIEGLKAKVTCVDPRVLDRALAGREFNDVFVDQLPAAVDPCGERGEFHTFAYAGPMFAAPIDVRVGPIVERDGFVFADLQ